MFLLPGELEVGSAPFVEQDVHRGTLKIRGVQEVDAGQYNCVASSSAGTFTGTVSLEVGGKTTLHYSAQSLFFSQTHTKREKKSILCCLRKHSGPIVSGGAR